MQRAGRVGEQQSGLVTVEELEAALREAVEEVDDVEVLDHRVRELDEGFDDPYLARHGLIRILLSWGRPTAPSLRTDPVPVIRRTCRVAHRQPSREAGSLE